MNQIAIGDSKRGWFTGGLKYIIEIGVRREKMISNLELLKQELIKDLLEKQESGFLKKQMWNY